MANPQIDKLLNSAIERNASDLHLKVGYKPILRIGGRLVRLNETVELDAEGISLIARNLMGDAKSVKFSETNNSDFSIEYKSQNGETRRFRANAAMADGHPYLALRVVPREIRNVETIGFPYEVWNDIINLKRGLVLVTGVTGSGKTTTLASLIQKINETRGDHIITIEDPVEYKYSPVKSMISQREVGIDVLSFGDGVKYCLRQDPDVILIGEIRDIETAEKALEAAATGHLVFSTLHTKSAEETVMRYVNMFPANDHDNIRDSLSANLEYVLSQQLLPYEKGGERTLAMEVMNVGYSAAIRNHLRKGEYHQLTSDIQTGRAGKMITMDARLQQLVGAGKISKEMAIAYAYKSDEMRKSFNRNQD
ncbi:Type II/IV secretion system protein [uncultured archaeon]|nr:Type II/IV secretion system protein [uncultured archaeon]